MEVDGEELDAAAHGARHALDRPEEEAHDTHAGVGEEGERLDEQPGIEDDLLQVVARPDGAQQAGRLRAHEAEGDRVARPHERRRVSGLEAPALRSHATA